MLAKQWVLAATAAGVIGWVGAGYAEPGEEGGPRDARQRRPGPPNPTEIFDQIDANGDGTVTREEFVKHHEQHFAGGPPEHPQMGPPMGPPPHDAQAQHGPRAGQPPFASYGPESQGFRPEHGGREMGPPQGPPHGPPPPRPEFGQQGPQSEQFAGRGPRGENQGQPCPYCQGTGTAAPGGRGTGRPPHPHDGQPMGPPPHMNQDGRRGHDGPRDHGGPEFRGEHGLPPRGERPDIDTDRPEIESDESDEEA